MSTRIKILLIAHPDGDSGSSLSIAMPRKRVLEAALPQDRAAQRRRLGSLRELTVQPATKKTIFSRCRGFLFLSAKGPNISTSPKVRARSDCLRLHRVSMEYRSWKGSSCGHLSGTTRYPTKSSWQSARVVASVKDRVNQRDTRQSTSVP